MSKVTVLDGSFSTQVSKHVGRSADGDPLWTARFLVTNPDAVRDTHLDFLRAGSDVIETNTYQASIDGFCKYLKVTEAESLEIMRNAVNLAKEAVKIYKKENKNKHNIINPLIAGSCGPYGAVLHDASEYKGSYDNDISQGFLKDWHRVRMETLIKSGIDILAIETIPSAKEAEALVNLLKEFPNTKAWLSFSCSNDGSTIVDGTPFAEIARKCYQQSTTGQLLAVGVNCLNPRFVSSYLSRINNDKSNRLPLVVYPNSGENYSPEKGWEDGKHFDAEKCINEWLDLGVKYIGGCCRTTAEDIATMRNQVNKWKSQEKEVL